MLCCMMFWYKRQVMKQKRVISLLNQKQLNEEVEKRSSLSTGLVSNIFLPFGFNQGLHSPSLLVLSSIVTNLPLRSVLTKLIIINCLLIRRWFILQEPSWSRVFFLSQVLFLHHILLSFSCSRVFPPFSCVLYKKEKTRYWFCAWVEFIVLFLARDSTTPFLTSQETFLLHTSSTCSSWSIRFLCVYTPLSRTSLKILFLLVMKTPENSMQRVWNDRWGKWWRRISLGPRHQKLFTDWSH